MGDGKFICRAPTRRGFILGSAAAVAFASEGAVRPAAADEPLSGPGM